MECRSIITCSCCVLINHELLILFLEVELQYLNDSVIYLVVGMVLESLQFINTSLLFEHQRKLVLSCLSEVIFADFEYIINTF